MNVNFMGNHLFIFKNYNDATAIRKIFNASSEYKKNECIISTKPNELLLLSGKEYNDYCHIKNLNNDVGAINEKSYGNAIIAAYKAAAIKIDLTKTNVNSQNIGKFIKQI